MLRSLHQACLCPSSLPSCPGVLFIPARRPGRIIGARTLRISGGMRMTGSGSFVAVTAAESYLAAQHPIGHCSNNPAMRLCHVAWVERLATRQLRLPLSPVRKPFPERPPNPVFHELSTFAERILDYLQRCAKPTVRWLHCSHRRYVRTDVMFAVTL